MTLRSLLFSKDLQVENEMEIKFVAANVDSDEGCEIVFVNPDDLIYSEDECESTEKNIFGPEYNDGCPTDDAISPRPNTSQNQNTEVQSLVCPTCQKVFSCTFTKNIHMRTVHTDERPFMCDYCSSRFKRKDHMQKHIYLVHEADRVRIGSSQKKHAPTKHLCAECGKIFCNKTTYQQHVDDVHSEIQKYHCEPCNKSFSRYSKLYRHRVVLNHGKNKFSKSCNYCGLEFQSFVYYVRHMTKHEEVKTCEMCNQNFGSSQEFKDHVSETHFEKKKFACDACDQKFTNKSTLALHRRAHSSDDKPFSCDYCGWKFKNKGHLVVHMYRHTGERPYKCNVCGRGFKQKGDMRKHKANHLINFKKTGVELESISNLVK